MIPVKEAIDLVRSTIRITKQTESLRIAKALGYVLASDVHSPIDMPPFRQSAMDGYAVKLDDVDRYNLIGEIKAGDPADYDLKKGEAVRIFTGAAVPDSSDTIVIQEHVERSSTQIHVLKPVHPDMNIRPRGEQVRKGELALKKGTKLNAAGIGYLSSLGIEIVEVFTKPKIALIITGNELQAPGQDLSPGKIYESNANMIKTALKHVGIEKLEILKVEDDYDSTLKTIEDAFAKNDIVMISGGISVGDYDFVGRALTDLGVNQVFYKVKQKPGKPLFFGEWNGKYAFALPGNPASSLSCFYMYVLPAIQICMGYTSYQPVQIQAISQSNFQKKGDRAQFLKAIYNNGYVSILEGQNSSMLHTFALANALVFVDEDTSSISVNDKVQLILLPQY